MRFAVTDGVEILSQHRWHWTADFVVWVHAVSKRFTYVIQIAS